MLVALTSSSLSVPNQAKIISLRQQRSACSPQYMSNRYSHNWKYISRLSFFEYNKIVGANNQNIFFSQLSKKYDDCKFLQFAVESHNCKNGKARRLFFIENKKNSSNTGSYSQKCFIIALLKNRDCISTKNYIIGRYVSIYCCS